MHRPGPLGARRNSAARWFAYAAAALTVTAAVGAHGMAWFAQAGHRPSPAFMPLNEARAQRWHAEADMAVTGSVPPRTAVAGESRAEIVRP